MEHLWGLTCSRISHAITFAILRIYTASVLKKIIYGTCHAGINASIEQHSVLAILGQLSC